MPQANEELDVSGAFLKAREALTRFALRLQESLIKNLPEYCKNCVIYTRSLVSGIYYIELIKYRHTVG